MFGIVIHLLEQLLRVIENESKNDWIECQNLIDLANYKVDTEAAKVKHALKLAILQQMQQKQQIFSQITTMIINQRCNQNPIKNEFSNDDNDESNNQNENQISFQKWAALVTQQMSKAIEDPKSLV